MESPPDKPGETSLFMMAISPGIILDERDLAAEMRRYVDYIETSPAADPSQPPWCPGGREGQCWDDRRRDGIPISPEGLKRLNETARAAGVTELT